MSQFGDKLKELRGSLTLYDVEKGTGISRAQIMRYESKQALPTPESTEKLANLFEVPYEELRLAYYEDLLVSSQEKKVVLKWAKDRLYSPTEQKLIEKIRQLSPEQQETFIERVLQFMDDMKP
jgi:transcriptional regulator with XRE-family HTH domain